MRLFLSLSLHPVPVCVSHLQVVQVAVQLLSHLRTVHTLRGNRHTTHSQVSSVQGRDKRGRATCTRQPLAMQGGAQWGGALLTVR